jgi:hypothetical protein
LRLWLSATNSEYMMKMKWARRPAIWMCTGLYLLEGVKLFSVSSRALRTSFRVSPDTPAAIAGIPLGGSLEIGPDASLELKLVSNERLVWAAQYRKIKAKYTRLAEGGDATLPHMLPLYPDVVGDVASEGVLRNASDDANAVQITLAAEPDDPDHGSHDGIDREEALYHERLEKAITGFEEYL